MSENKKSILVPETTDTGSLALVSYNDQVAFATKLIKEGLVPSTFKTTGQVIMGIQFAKDLNVPVVPWLKQMYIINNQPNLHTDGPLALCQRSKYWESMVEFFIDEKGDKICFDNKNLKSRVWGAVCRVKRKGDPEIQEDSFTLDDLKRSGIDKNKYGKKDTWEKFERNMMRYKARSMALKSKFSDCLQGIGILEYDHHQSLDFPEYSNQRTSADELNEKYGFVDEKEKNQGSENAREVSEPTVLDLQEAERSLSPEV